MERIVHNDRLFTLYEYSKEDEFEKHVIEHSKEIFGPKSVYIDIKKRIGEDNILTIPDGYLIDLSFPFDPRLYILENVNCFGDVLDQRDVLLTHRLMLCFPKKGGHDI